MTVSEIRELIAGHPEYQGNKIEWLPLLRKCYPNNPMIYTKYMVLDLTKFNNSNITKEIVFCLFICLLKRRLKWISLMRGYLRYIPYLASFIADGKYIFNSLLDIDSKTERLFVSYVVKSRTEYGADHIFLHQMKLLLHDELYANDYFERNVWNLEAFHLPEYRYSKVSGIRRFDFRCVENEKNRNYLKRYVEYDLRKKDISISTLYGKFSRIRCFMQFICEINADDFQREIVEDYIHSLNQSNIKNNSFNSSVFAIKDFYEVGIQLGFWNNIPVYFGFYIKKNDARLSYKCVSDYVIQQIFSVLHKTNYFLAVFFLLLYFTGMRESEACLFKVDGLVDDGKHRYVRFYQLKMRKEVANPIPEKLFQLLSCQKNKVLTNDAEEIYMFPSSHQIPVSIHQINKAMKKLIKKENIHEEDGTLYRFRAHAYRHGLAMRLLHHDVPLFMIQKLLHHNTPEMSLVYARLDEQTRRRHYLEFCDLQGEKSDELNEESKRIDDDIIWMRHMISQALPNGYCSLPIKLGQCPHANACLSCEQFRTTKEFLPVLKYQKAKFKQLERLYMGDKNDEAWMTMQFMQNNLTKIINSLEEGVNHAD